MMQWLENSQQSLHHSQKKWGRSDHHHNIASWYLGSQQKTEIFYMKDLKDVNYAIRMWFPLYRKKQRIQPSQGKYVHHFHMDEDMPLISQTLSNYFKLSKRDYPKRNIMYSFLVRCLMYAKVGIVPIITFAIWVVNKLLKIRWLINE